MMNRRLSLMLVLWACLLSPAWSGSALAQELGVSRERVRQLEGRALDTIRRSVRQEAAQRGWARASDELTATAA